MSAIVFDLEDFREKPGDDVCEELGEIHMAAEGLARAVEAFRDSGRALPLMTALAEYRATYERHP